MKNRFHVPAGLQLGATIELSGDEFHHAVRVHRSRAGDEVELFDGAGLSFVGRIESISKTSASIVIVAMGARRDPDLRVDLALALIQPDRFEMVLQKGTELGVSRFLPLITERIEVSAQRVAKKLERWEKIVLEAAKQCGRSVLPRVDPPVSFGQAIARNGLRVLFDADAPADAFGERPSAVTLLIGPEGGWSPAELQQARQAGCLFQRLGPRRLRAETAAIAAVTMVGLRYGDLGA